ncbi:hypothetical protein BVC80_1395g147 [Macleaya cordata]|uniref:Uncharacterized protein n=1 Tax=Macleaya cordata TaxID=56857 RepID=A0A200Q1T3_MACCD|nr:hypothetical protein BVC80_1395g147 [Macleaya cordata]
MERRENQPQPLGICRRLFGFVMNSIAIRGLKRVTLGRPPLHSPMTQEPIVSSPQNEAGYMGNDEPVIVQIPDHDGVPKNGLNSLIEIEVHQTSNGSKDSSPVQVRASSLRTVPVEDNRSNNKPNDANDREKDKSTTSPLHVRDSYIVPEPVKTQEKGSNKVVGSSVPKKTVSIKDGAAERDLTKRREMNIPREKLTLAMDEPEKDMNMNVPRPLRPVLRAASNINEKSDDFIRRRKEALRKSMTIEPRT